MYEKKIIKGDILRKIISLVSLTVVLLLSGCVSKESLIKMRAELSNPETLQKNAKTINEILSEKSDNPYLYSEAMKTGMIMSRDGNLFATSKLEYEKLINNYINLRKTDKFKEEIKEAGLDPVVFNKFVDDYAIYCTANSSGYRLPEALIDILYTLTRYEEKRTHIAIFNGLLQYIDAIKSKPEYISKTLVGLSRFKQSNRMSTDEKSLLASLENELVTLKNINYIYKNYYKYLKTTNQYEYIFSLNESIFNNIIGKKESIADVSILKENIKLLMNLSLNEDIDEKYKFKAKELLLNYMPVAYFVMKYKTKEKVFALTELISLYEYAKKEDAASSLNDEIVYISTNEEDKRKYISHQKVFGKNIFKKIDETMISYFINAIETVIKNENKAYHSFYYSYLINIAPNKYVKYVLSSYKQNINYEDLVNSITYVLKAQKEKVDDEVYKAVAYIYQNIAPKFDENIYKTFNTTIAVHLAKDKTNDFLKITKAHILNDVQISSRDTFLLNFIFALDKLKKDYQKYSTSFDKILKWHDESSTTILSNYLKIKDIDYLHNLYLKNLMNSSINFWELTIVGDMSLKNKKLLKTKILSKLQKAFYTMIENKNDDISFQSAQFAKALGSKKVLEKLSNKFDDLKL